MRDTSTQSNKSKRINGHLRQQIRYLGVFPLKISAEIKHDTGEEVNDERETDGKK